MFLSTVCLTLSLSLKESFDACSSKSKTSEHLKHSLNRRFSAAEKGKSVDKPIKNKKPKSKLKMKHKPSATSSQSAIASQTGTLVPSVTGFVPRPVSLKKTSKGSASSKKPIPESEKGILGPKPSSSSVFPSKASSSLKKSKMHVNTVKHTPLIPIKPVFIFLKML